MSIHRSEPLNELETRCCAWKGQRVMDLTAVMRKDAFSMQRCCVYIEITLLNMNAAKGPPEKKYIAK